MDLAGYVVNAVLVDDRSVAEVCEAHDISRSWLYELIAPGWSTTIQARRLTLSYSARASTSA